MNEQTSMYRLYGTNDELLYIGIARRVGSRLNQHADDKEWWGEVQRVAWEKFDTREAALDAEREAIKIGRPKYNVTHNGASRHVPKVVVREAIANDNVVAFNASPSVIFDEVGLDIYNRLGAVMNELACHLDKESRDGETVGTRQEFLDVLAGLARSLVYGDCCDKCYTTRFPYALKFESSGARCAYVCHSCERHRWTCWWTTDLAVLARIG